MYNLLVASAPDAWNGAPYKLELDRCVREYTLSDIEKRLSGLTAENVSEIRRMPSIFAYETINQKPPNFGIIRDVTVRQGKARVEYELIPLESFLTVEDLSKHLVFELDIAKLEMNRTHWAVKDVNLARELKPRGIELPHWARQATNSVDIGTHKFEVGLSFPGEHRRYVEQVANELEHRIGPDSYFYDNNYSSQLARPSLDILLQDIYRNRSRLVVVFIGSDYQKKRWCGVEFHAIRDIIFDQQLERIMYVKMDDGEVEGVFRNDGYISGKTKTPLEVAALIEERLNKSV